MKTSDKFKAILCNPDNIVCIDGSDEDKFILQEAILEVEDLEKYSRHTHKSKNDGTDICAKCGFDIRHNMHLN